MAEQLLLMETRDLAGQDAVKTVEMTGFRVPAT